MGLLWEQFWSAASWLRYDVPQSCIAWSMCSFIEGSRTGLLGDSVFKCCKKFWWVARLRRFGMSGISFTLTSSLHFSLIESIIQPVFVNPNTDLGTLVGGEEFFWDSGDSHLISLSSLWFLFLRYWSRSRVTGDLGSLLAILGSVSERSCSSSGSCSNPFS